MSIRALCALLFVASLTTKASGMADNEKYLDQARERAKTFEAELEPERLREAYMALENVRLVVENDPKVRYKLRAECLIEWLGLLRLLDRFLDPGFNPRDVPPRLIQPPPTKAGVIYPPGADPALIDDPKARSEYERAIQANQAKIESHRLQTHLSRLNETLFSRAADFIRSSYTASKRDQEEVRRAVEKHIENSRRKAALLERLDSRVPN
jgi:hypothetical protein